MFHYYSNIIHPARVAKCNVREMQLYHWLGTDVNELPMHPCIVMTNGEAHNAFDPTVGLNVYSAMLYLQM